ncbi:DUF115 domain-containing protein [bacterium]|nr:DUF115 domain-containing protein [bacterium]
MTFKLIKDIARKVSPRWLWKALSFLNLMLFVRDAKGLKKIKFIKNKDQAIVLGNGPSLKSDMEKIAEVSDQYDFVCVNNFATSPYFSRFKPTTYVFLDSYFFSHDAHPDWIKQREKTFAVINESTFWKMKIFLPAFADKSILTEKINNPNVQIIKFKVLPYVNSNLKKVINRYKTGFFGPYQCNVLIYAVYLALWARYKEIKIYGADLSFHNDVEVDQTNNHLQMRVRHFNSPDHVERLTKNPQKIEPFKMSALMQTTADTFISHDALNEFAKIIGVQIVNKSSVSMIDAYDRSEKNQLL